MITRLKVCAAFAVGYVLGAKAGRERYNQIVSRARALWGDPRVQDSAADVQHAAEATVEQARQVIKEKLPGHEGTAGHETSRP